MANVAVTDLTAFMDIVQGPVPKQAPPHPVKVDPVSVIAFSVTDVPALNSAEQAEPQLIPEGLLTTAPNPVPEMVAVMVYIWMFWLNVAVIVRV